MGDTFCDKIIGRKLLNKKSVKMCLMINIGGFYFKTKEFAI